MPVVHIFAAAPGRPYRCEVDGEPLRADDGQPQAFATLTEAVRTYYATTKNQMCVEPRPDRPGIQNPIEPRAALAQTKNQMCVEPRVGLGRICV
jgi:hypothetical protein